LAGHDDRVAALEIRDRFVEGDEGAGVEVARTIEILEREDEMDFGVSMKDATQFISDGVRLVVVERLA
jgi:hypothetical protein